jgi:hypothetical protein
MRMSEVYQPAAIICLIYHGGTAKLQEIHAQLEARRRERDRPFEEREESATRGMPCQVLIDNELIEEEPKGTYHLRDFDAYSPQQLTAIIALCEDSIAHWNRNRS